VKILICLICAVIGYLLAQLYPLPYFTIDKNLDFAEVLNILVTLGVAYWLTNVIERRNETSRAEKNLFLKWSDEISISIRLFANKSNSGIIELKNVTSACKQIAQSIDSLFDTLKANGYDFEAKKSTLLNKVNIVKDALTNTPPLSSQSTIPAEISVNNNVVTVSGNRLIKLVKDFEELKKEFFNFQVALNKK